MPHSEPASPAITISGVTSLGNMATPSLASPLLITPSHHCASNRARCVQCTSFVAISAACRNAGMKVRACGMQAAAHVCSPTKDMASFLVTHPTNTFSQPSFISCNFPCGIAAVYVFMSYTTPNISTTFAGPSSFWRFIGIPNSSQITSNLRTASSASASLPHTKQKSSM